MVINMKNEYPVIKVESKNPTYAKILLESYAGEISEDSAVHQYIYQHIVLKQTNKALSDALLEISMTEMRHLDILGELVSLLGTKPIYSTYNYFTDNFIPWNSNYINYTTSVSELLMHDIKLEELAIENYNKTIDLVKDTYIINIIKAIIAEEKQHIEIFKSFLKQV